MCWRSTISTTLHTSIYCTDITVLAEVHDVPAVGATLMVLSSCHYPPSWIQSSWPAAPTVTVVEIIKESGCRGGEFLYLIPIVLCWRWSHRKMPCVAAVPAVGAVLTVLSSCHDPLSWIPLSWPAAPAVTVVKIVKESGCRGGKFLQGVSHEDFLGRVHL